MEERCPRFYPRRDMPPANRTLIVLLGILTTIMLGWVLHVGAGILQPLVIALLLASMLQPVVRGLARVKIPPIVTVVLIVSMLFWGIARVSLLVRNNFVAILGNPTETAQPSESEEPGEPRRPTDPFSEVPETRAEAINGWKAIIQGIRERVEASSVPRPVATFLLASLDEVDAPGLLTGAIGSGIDFSRSTLLVLIYMLFIFAEQAVFRRKILSISGDRREETAEVLDTIGRGIQRYLGVKTITSLVTGAICYAVLTWLELPFAPLFGFLTFLLNYIPTFGSIIAGILPTVTALAINRPLNVVLTVAATYLAVNLVLGSWIEPKILGRELNLSPLVIIISVVVWAGLWGVVGGFLAVPLTATIQSILASRENTRP
ncbi:MAG: AI-2E family transporter, partial [Planctomycetota bacterium]